MADEALKVSRQERLRDYFLAVGRKNPIDRSTLRDVPNGEAREAMTRGPGVALQRVSGIDVQEVP